MSDSSGIFTREEKISEDLTQEKKTMDEIKVKLDNIKALKDASEKEVEKLTEEMGALRGAVARLSAVLASDRAGRTATKRPQMSRMS